MKPIHTLFALAFVASPVAAAEMIFQTNGQVTGISALQNSTAASVPSGTIKVGDIYTLSALVDLDKATLTSVFDADPAINLYYLPGAIVTLRVGSYSTTFTPANSSLQLWNDRVIVNPTDSQSFSFFRYQAPSSEVPFDMGPGQVSYSTNFNAFDFSGQARTNDLISQFTPFDQFGSKSFSLGFLNSDSNLFVQVAGSVTGTSFIASAVPEPSTWIMMLLGFGLIGSVARKTGRQNKLSGRPSLR